MTAVLFHKRVFDQIGLLDARFESYYEDVDFGVRCALAGLSGIYEPAAVAVHMDKASSGKKRGRDVSDRPQPAPDSGEALSRATLRRFAWPILVGQILALMAAAKQGDPLAAFKGKCEALWRWRTFREPINGLAGCPPIETAMSRSELEIYDLQRKIGYDIYWRLYFSLVRPVLIVPMEPGLVAITIVTYNSGEYIERCLRYVLEQDYPRKEIIVVDNASADHTPDIVRKFGDSVRTVYNQQNVGFAAGQNQAIAVAGGMDTDAKSGCTARPKFRKRPGVRW